MSVAIASTAFAAASVDKPQNMTAKITNPSFEEGNINGWTTKNSDDTGARDNNNATYHVDNADGRYVFNTWSAGYAITQTISSMPNGVYKLQGMVTSSDDCTNVYLLANGNHKAITLETSPKTGRKQTYFTTGEMIFYTTDGQITIGACGSAKDGKSFATEGEWWYKADNFQLTYYGNEADAWTFALDDYKKSIAINAETKVSKTVMEEWESLLNSLSVSDVTSYTSAIETINKMVAETPKEEPATVKQATEKPATTTKPKQTNQPKKETKSVETVEPAQSAPVPSTATPATATPASSSSENSVSLEQLMKASKNKNNSEQ